MNKIDSVGLWPEDFPVSAGDVIVGAAANKLGNLHAGAEGYLLAVSGGIPAWQSRFVAAPGTASSTGAAGSIAYDATHFYVCIATNTWVRVALATW